MYLLGFFILVLLLLFYVLFKPVILVVNTSTSEYYVQMKGLFKASLIGDEETVLKLNLKVLFFNYNFYPLRMKLKQKKELNKQKGEIKNRRVLFKKGLKFIKSIKVNKMYVNIDTGDCIANAKLYPMFTFFNYHFGTFKINYMGENEVVVNLKSRPWNLVKAIINL